MCLFAKPKCSSLQEVKFIADKFSKQVGWKFSKKPATFAKLQIIFIYIYVHIYILVSYQIVFNFQLKIVRCANFMFGVDRFYVGGSQLISRHWQLKQTS